MWARGSSVEGLGAGNILKDGRVGLKEGGLE